LQHPFSKRDPVKSRLSEDVFKKCVKQEKQLDEIISASNTTPQVIFKHSTRCGTSKMVKNRLERNDNPAGINFYLVDLFKYRNISNRIASQFNVMHESPQVLVINNGNCIYDESHSAIVFDEIEEVVAQK
jgi:bacillithiol system protein YtxJ